MSYKNAKDILPPALLAEIQQYSNGELIYIPTISTEKIKWGSRTGARSQYRERNSRIKTLYTERKSCQELADMFCLSIDSIRKIVHM